MKKINYFILILITTSSLLAQAAGWVEQPVNPTPPPLNSVNAISSNVCWIAGNNGTVLYTSNGGANWFYRNVTGYTTYATNVIAGLDSVTALCSITTPQFTYIFRTTNQGNNWSIVFTQVSPAQIVDIKMINSSLGFALGNPVNSKWTFLKISNNGILFDSTGLYIPQIVGDFAWFNSMYVNSTNIWYGTASSHVYHSTNSGTSWSFSSTPFQTVHCVTFISNIGFAGGDLIAESTTSGASWFNVSLPGSGSCLTFANNTNLIWYGRGSQIYFSSNNGTNFVLQHNSPDNSNYVQLSFVFSSFNNIQSTITGWGITNSGLIAHYQQGNGIIKINNEVPSMFELYQNYPNPFNPNTKIKFDIAGNNNLGVKLIIYDNIGNVVETLVNDKLNQGKYEIEWNSSAYSSGVYYYKLTAGDFTSTRKMVVLK